MTLAELVVTLKLNEKVSIPNSLKNFKIVNERDFSQNSKKIYLMSQDFQKDMIEILDSLITALPNFPLNIFALSFDNDYEGNLHMIVCA